MGDYLPLVLVKYMLFGGRGALRSDIQANTARLAEYSREVP